MKIELPRLSQKRRTLRPSFSRWDNFSNRCERLYALDILFGQESSPALEKGSQVHDLLEIFLRRVREMNYDVAAATDYVLERAEQWPKGPRTAEELEPFVVSVARLVDRWGGQVKHVEEWIDYVDGMPFSGKIDLVIDHKEHGLTVVDWKTCSTTTAPWIKLDKRDAKKSLQLKIYCLALDVRRAGFVYLPNSAEPRDVFVKFSDSELNLAKRQLRSMAATIENRWRSAGMDLQKDERDMWYIDNPAGAEVDLTPFAEAGSEMPWCSARNCRHWKNCLGRRDPEVV